MVISMGLSWDTYEDCFCFEFKKLIKFVESLPPTKRSLLPVSGKILDPLGFLSPFTVSTKILLQSLCLDKVKWDDRLEGEVLLKWNGHIHEFSMLTNLQVPKCCLMKDQVVLACKLHGFSYASERAYAAVVYLKIVYQQEGAGNIQIVASRTRVCPLKKQSIPRLELLGATILARLLNSVRGCIHFYQSQRFTAGLSPLTHSVG